MENPFDILRGEVAQLRELIAAIPTQVRPPEIIDRSELQRRLGITEPTVIKFVRNGRIPEIKLGAGICRYNWPDVVEALKSN